MLHGLFQNPLNWFHVSIRGRKGRVFLGLAEKICSKRTNQIHLILKLTEIGAWHGGLTRFQIPNLSSPASSQVVFSLARFVLSFVKDGANLFSSWDIKRGGDEWQLQLGLLQLSDLKVFHSVVGLLFLSSSTASLANVFGGKDALMFRHASVAQTCIGEPAPFCRIMRWVNARVSCKQ